ncbi:MAG: histidine triad nucleotide-binding protein [Dehalococcoidales bacterium]|nr:histidine triad nucleotide-binding protein [Dehalococcoidales bacterium]
MEDCIFCKIISGDIPGDIVYRDEDILAFRDINPVAPTHILIIPVRHIVTVTDIPDSDMSLASKMMKVAKDLTIEEGITENGYRLVINCGEQGGQIVKHLHMHLIGGRQLSEKLG